MNNMKIFVASSAELKNERMELVDLMLDLNDELEGQATKLKPVLWEFMDSSMGAKHKEEEYLDKLRECETCLVLFWKELGKYTVMELDDAVKEMNVGRLPKKVYAFFKEPANDITNELADFKDSFSQNYPSISVKIFKNAKELRELVTDFVKESASQPYSLQTRKESSSQNSTSGLKEVKIMFAASEELHVEKTYFS